MTKPIVTRLFVGGILAVLAGAILGVAVVWIAIANDLFVMHGPDIVGFRAGTLAWPLIGLGIVAAAAMTAGFVAGVVAWIGALLDTSRIASKAWFIGLLLTGIFGFGFLAMIAYVLAGPDGTTGTAVPRGPAPSAATPA